MANKIKKTKFFKHVAKPATFDQACDAFGIPKKERKRIQEMAEKCSPKKHKS